MAIDEKILIPLVDLQANYVSIKDEIDNAIKNVLCESTYIKGSHVNIF